MTVGKAIYYLLTNATDVTDVVSTRIYPEIAQQDADLPYIVYAIANNEPTDTKPEPSKLDTAQVEVNIYSDSYRVVIDLAVAVRAALDRVQGTYAGVNVQSIQYLNEVIDFDEPQRAYNINADYDVRISRTDFDIAQGTPVTGAQLGQLADVDVDGVSNGQLIAYNSMSGNWEAADDATGSNTLTGLTDTSITTPANREALIYDGGNWVNDNISKSDVGLGNVDNTSDGDKPVSSATQTALNAKANSADFSNVDNTSDANKPVSTATQTALNAKADTSSVPTELNDLSDVTITGTPAGNEALIFDTTTSSFKSLPNFTNRFEDDAENHKPTTPFVERVYTVKADGDGIFIDAQSDTPSSGKKIERKIYHKAGFLESGDAIGDFTLIHTFADDTAYSATTSTFEGFRDGDTYGSPPFTLLQTWEEATAAPAFTGLLNESYGSGAAAAYSVRRLNGNYTGAAIEVERSSDNTKQDIGFDVNGNLDESALSTFCSGTTGKVRTWYDQSQTGGTGSGNDAVQATHANQPTIYTGAAIVKENGRVAVDFDGTDDWLDLGTNQLGTTELFADSGDEFSVFQYANIDGSGTVFSKAIASSSGREYQLFYDSNKWTYRIRGTANDFPELQHENKVLSSFHWSGSAASAYFNSVSKSITVGSASKTTQDINIGARSDGSFVMNGTIQEIIAYDSDKSTDRSSIEENVGDYFTQNTPLLDTYTGAAAAYSLRKLRTAYSGSAVRVRRSNDNAETDIGFNVFGELDTVSLAAHCGSNDGFVKTWYDQSGNTNDATQTSTGSQPKIYDGTTGVVTENGKPAVQFDGTNDELPTGVDIRVFTNFAVAAADDDTQNVIFGSATDSSEFVRSEAGAVRLQNQQGVTTSATTTNQNLIYAFNDSTSEIAVNGGSVNTASLQTDDFNSFVIGVKSGAFFYNGRIQEILVYDSDQSSNRTNIESNINTFYSIF